VPQSFVPDRTLALTVGELLAAARQRLPVALATTAAARARVAGALRLVGLDGFERRLLCELSGGELRRVLIGHAFEPRPALLLLDEPTEGLDAESAARFVDLLREARAAGAAALLVTHDRALVERVADDVTPMAAR
jgi:ABC-type Mn2+/Zn2+ transport system ATPase subunit